MLRKLILWVAKNPRAEEAKLVLQLMDEIDKLKEELEKFKIVAYARKNDRNDLFDLRLNNNPFVDQNLVIPLYAKEAND